MKNAKAALRKNLLEKRKQISQEAAKAAASSIIHHFLFIIPQNSIVAGYSAMNGELDVFPLLREISARGNKVCLPVTGDGSKILKFREWLLDLPLQAGKYGVLCPPENSQEFTPDVLIVPLVGFGKCKNRIGYGGGYYDATIASLRAKNKAVKIIGVAYSLQQVEKLPCEEHDEVLDMVVTEAGMIG